MDQIAEAERVARRLVEEYNRGLPDWVEACHAEHTRWTELPLFGGHGRSGGRAELRKAAEGALEAFPDRRMALINVVAGPGKAAIEVDWTGRAAHDSAQFKAGETLRLRIAFILGIEDGKIVRQVDYCIPMGEA